MKTGDFELEMAAVGYLLAIDFNNDVTALDAGFFRWTIRSDIADQRSAAFLEIELLGQSRGEILDHHTQIATCHVTVFDETLHGIAGEVRRNSETDALIATGAAQDGCVDADQTALGVHQGATGVAGIDRGVGLDEVLIIQPDGAASASGTDDTSGHGLADAERIADRQHYIPHLNFVTVGHGHSRQVLGVHFNHGDVALGVATDDFGGEFAAILQRHFDLVSAIDD